MSSWIRPSWYAALALTCWSFPVRAQASGQEKPQESSERKPTETVFKDETGRPRARVKETIIGFSDPAMTEDSMVSSPDGTRLGYVVMSGQGLAVVVDGIKGQNFEGIAQESLLFSSDGKHFGYVGTRAVKQFAVVDDAVYEYDGVSQQGVVFSPDGKRVAWVAARNGMQFAVIDGKESPPYEGVLPMGVVFSDDGQHCAYAAHSGEQDMVVVDGEDGPLFDEVHGFAFTPKEGRWFYVGKRESHWYGVIDGVPYGPYDQLRSTGAPAADKDAPPNAFVVSSKGSRVAFVAKKGADFFAVVDGKELGPFKGCGGLTISQDGSRVAYMATRGEEWFVSVEGEPERTVKGLQTFSLAPDGRHSAATIKRGDKVLAVVDGIEGKEYDRILEPGVIFSSDGKRTAYVAQTKGELLVVTDGKESERFRLLGKGGIGFVPNSSRLVYFVQRGDRECLVIDGVSGPPALSFRGLSFSSDGARWAYGAEKEKSKWTVVVDGVEHGPGGPLAPGEDRAYQWIAKRTPHFSPDGKHVAWICVSNGRCVVVVDGVESRAYDAIQGNMLDFTPDSQHVIFMGAKGEKCVIVLDGFEIEGGWKGFLRDSELVFDGPKRFSIRGSRTPRFLLVEVEIL